MERSKRNTSFQVIGFTPENSVLNYDPNTDRDRPKNIVLPARLRDGAYAPDPPVLTR